MKCVVLSLIIAAMQAMAAPVVILQVTSGNETATEFFGESFTTPAGGPWNQITFNYYAGFPAVTPVAAGNAFLLTQEYLGTPSALSSATPGFLAESTGIVAGMYVFSPSLILNPGIQYWLYENGVMTNSGFPLGGTPGQQAYFAATATSNFDTLGGGQLSNFSLQGSVIPEPATLGIASCGFLVLLTFRRVRRHS